MNSTTMESPLRVEHVRLPSRVHAGNVKETLGRIRATAGSFVVVDLSDALALDSTALGEIVRIHRRLVASGGAVILAAPSTGIRRVLGITRLDGIFAIHADVATATASLGASS